MEAQRQRGVVDCDIPVVIKQTFDHLLLNSLQDGKLLISKEVPILLLLEKVANNSFQVSQFSSYELISFLISFLKNLPNPLFSNSSVFSLSLINDTNVQKGKLRPLIATLPLTNRHSLKALVHFVFQYYINNAFNQFVLESCSSVFGKLCFRGENKDDSENELILFRLMVTEYEYLFDKMVLEGTLKDRRFPLFNRKLIPLRDGLFSIRHSELNHLLYAFSNSTNGQVCILNSQVNFLSKF